MWLASRSTPPRLGRSDRPRQQPRSSRAAAEIIEIRGKIGRAKGRVLPRHVSNFDRINVARNLRFSCVCKWSTRARTAPSRYTKVACNGGEGTTVML